MCPWNTPNYKSPLYRSSLAPWTRFGCALSANAAPTFFRPLLNIWLPFTKAKPFFGQDFFYLLEWFRLLRAPTVPNFPHQHHLGSPSRCCLSTGPGNVFKLQTLLSALAWAVHRPVLTAPALLSPPFCLGLWSRNRLGICILDAIDSLLGFKKSF